MTSNAHRRYSLSICCEQFSERHLPAQYDDDRQIDNGVSYVACNAGERIRIHTEF